MKPILIIQGANYGSEAKGTVAGALCVEREVDIAVRTGSINAGHTVYFNGKPYKMQIIPVGWVNPKTNLFIGPGAYIHPEILAREVEMINEAMPDADVKQRLFIDQRAALHTDEHIDREQGTKIHERMGSTGEGVAEAIKDKMDRKGTQSLFISHPDAHLYHICDTVDLLHAAYDDGAQILLEGTQGTMLDLHLGHYPFVTSRQVDAAAWVAEAGLSPAMEYEVVLVSRTFPIRVAGNSGPFPSELSWPEFTRELNTSRKLWDMEPAVPEDVLDRYEASVERAAQKLGLPNGKIEQWDAEMRAKHSEAISNLHREAMADLMAADEADIRKFFEFTTVTKKLRRIARLDIPELKFAIKVNRPAYLALNFLNYKFPFVENCATWEEIAANKHAHWVFNYILDLEKEAGVEVGYVNVNPFGIIKVDRKTLTDYEKDGRRV